MLIVYSYTINETNPSKFPYIFTCIDRTTRWIKPTPMIDITALTIAITFLNSLITRFDVPLLIVVLNLKVNFSRNYRN